jgi:methylated-DNA-[protein]-cysteine S-methyltransferase
MPPARFASLETPIGRLWLTATDVGLRSIDRGDHAELTGIPDPDGLAEAIGQVAAYFDGTLRDFSLRLDLRDRSAFDAAVWHAAMVIPHGETRSYGDLAADVGAPRAARAVGGAMARCPLFPIVPCHRVIHADGSLGGWGTELWIKRWLLRHEGAAVVPRRIRASHAPRG